MSGSLNGTLSTQPDGAGLVKWEYNGGLINGFTKHGDGVQVRLKPLSPTRPPPPSDAVANRKLEFCEPFFDLPPLPR